MKISTLATGKEVFDLLRDDLEAIEREFGSYSVSNVQAITEIGEYLRQGGGKRLRPALLLLAAKLLSYQGTRSRPAGRGGGDHSHRDAGA